MTRREEFIQIVKALFGANANFIANPGAHSLTKYYETEQEGVYICKEFTLNITEKLNVSIIDDQIQVAPKPTQPSQ